MQFFNNNENKIDELNDNEINEFVKQNAQNVILLRFFVQIIENKNHDFFDDQIVHFKTLIRKSNRNFDDDKIKTFKKKISNFFLQNRKNINFRVEFARRKCFLRTKCFCVN